MNQPTNTRTGSTLGTDATIPLPVRTSGGPDAVTIPLTAPGAAADATMPVADFGGTRSDAATIPLTAPGAAADATMPVADFSGAAASGAVTVSAFRNADPNATVPMAPAAGTAPTRITTGGGGGRTPAPTQATDPAAPTRLSSGGMEPGTARIDTATGGLTGTASGTRRRTRINGTLPADTQALDLKLQLSRISVFADMANHSGGNLTGKLNRLVEAHGTHGRYVVQRPLAQGGMGAVLEIKDGDFQRRAAMKIILPRFAKTPETLERFLAEAQVTAQLEHPNIVPIHDLGVMDDGTLYFTMKFIEGQSLGGVVKKLKSEDAAVRSAAQATWTLEQILLTFLKVLDGVGFAHSRGVVHRDLKPDNIMLGGHGEVLVVDWGIAKVLGEADLANELVQKVVSVRDNDNLSATMAGNAIGTIYYMPPEQAEGRLDDIDARSDVYALGATLYELITLKRPLETGNLQQMVLHAATGRIIPILTSKPDLHPDVAAVVMKAMACTPDYRYQSCAAFADDLRRFLAGQAVEARRRNLIERLGAWVQQHRRQVLAGTAALALAVAAVSGTVAYQGRQDRAEAALQFGLARTALATGELEKAKDHIIASLSRHADGDANALKGEIIAKLEEQERRRDEILNAKKAEKMLAEAATRFAAPDPDLPAINQDLITAWALARLDGIAELRTRVAIRLKDAATLKGIAEARALKDACDRQIANAAQLPITDATLDGLVDQAVATLKQVRSAEVPPPGLDETGAALKGLREGIARKRQLAADRTAADEQAALARQALDARRLDEALAAITTALSHVPGDAALDTLRQGILDARTQARLKAEQEVRLQAARKRAEDALHAAMGANALMLGAARQVAELEPQIATLERSGKGQDRDTLLAARRDAATARQKVAEEWALVEQSAATAVAAVDEDRTFTSADGTRPWTTARRLLADLYWGRLAVAQANRSLPEIAAFTNLLKRFDDGAYRDRLTGDATLAIQGGGSATLAPITAQNGRLVAGGVDETLTLPLMARTHASGRFALQAGGVGCAIYLPPNGNVTIALPATLPAVPGHDCRVVLAADGGRGFLLGTYEVTQAQYLAFIKDQAVWPEVQKTWRTTVERPEIPLRLLPRRSLGPDSVTWQIEPSDIGIHLTAVSLPAGMAELPVTGVSRDDAEAYCAWLAKRSGQKVRLPTRAEWQYAATGGDPQRIHPWGETFDRTFPVCAMSFPAGKADAQKPGSHPADCGPFGHLDLAGNVREWLADRPQNRDDLLVWHGAIMAGGGYFDTNPDTFRSAYTESLAPDMPNGQIGFRILVEIP